ncbi:MAG: phospholipid transport system substrate-binding protein [Candidatus Azotimanducaceae bacterium]|jgi:phospholipid transport system substrate-binding protein
MMKKWVIIKLLLLVVVFSQNVFSTEVDPQQLIKQVTDRVLGEIKINSDDYRANPDKLFALVDEVVLPHFNFVAMTNLALHRHRQEFNDEQKIKIVHEFKTLLIRTYGKALLEYSNQGVNYLDMLGSVEKGKVKVKTEVTQAGGLAIPLDYSLRLGKQGWKVYDIQVDGISLVTNYRSSFSREITKNGVEGLIKLLHERNQ